MPVLKNNSVRIIHVGDSMILPGRLSDDLPDEVMDYSGVKALLGSRDLTDETEKAARGEAKEAPKPVVTQAPAAVRPAAAAPPKG